MTTLFGVRLQDVIFLLVMSLILGLCVVSIYVMDREDGWESERGRIGSDRDAERRT